MKVINLFGGPGCGKSTMAAGLFYHMKQAGMNCELVSEFAKDLTWERSPARLCQPYVFGVQYLRLQRLLDHGVEYAIVDSPLLLSLHYASEAMPMAWFDLVDDLFHTFDNYNYVLIWPDRKYEQVGRNQPEHEARQIHEAVWKMLNDYRIAKQPIYADGRGINAILNDIRGTDAVHSAN